MRKMRFVLLLITLFFFCDLQGQQLIRQGTLKELFAGPSSMSHRQEWLNALQHWRKEEKEQLGYNDSLYLQHANRWVDKTFIYTLAMVQDRYLYDPAKGQYTVDRYLNDLKARYGGIDAVLIWFDYPNMGVDNRNQFDLLKDLPGGLAGIKKMIQDFKKHGVRVFLPFMVWDIGTRKTTRPLPALLVQVAKYLDVDGIFGDTMGGIPEAISDLFARKGYPVVLQPEWTISDLKMLQWNQTSWGYFWSTSDTAAYDFQPGVCIYKWFEPRHQVFVTNRWATSRMSDLQYAFFNGLGYNAWEDVWGVWNPVVPRDAAVIRRIASLYREFPDIWSSQEWEPFIPVTQQGVFSTAFPDNKKTVYTFINRDSTAKKGVQLVLPYRKHVRYFDLWNGVPLIPRVENGQTYLSFPIESNGFGCVLAAGIHDTLDGAFYRFLADQRSRNMRMRKNDSPAWQPVSQKIVPIQQTKSYQQRPSGMLPIPAVKHYLFRTQGVMLEGQKLPGANGIQYPWEVHPADSQSHWMSIPSFYMDQYPVTNKQFKIFLEASRYHPRDDHNFLKDWKNGSYPAGWGNKPVTWVSIEDARAYAAWAGKRLPHEWEWQYAAQGNDGRSFPWGNQRDPSLIPPKDTNRTLPPPADVNEFPLGASPFGVCDMVGSIWQWTDEYTDPHTRVAVLKGGSCYDPKGDYYSGQAFTGWYFPPVRDLHQYGKYLLMAPCLDRSALIGFRCVADLK